MNYINRTVIAEDVTADHAKANAPKFTVIFHMVGGDQRKFCRITHPSKLIADAEARYADKGLPQIKFVTIIEEIF